MQRTYRAQRHKPVNCVVVIILGLLPDPVPQLGGSQLGPPAVLGRGESTRLNAATAAPAAGGRLSRAGVREAGGRAQQAVKEVADSGGEHGRLHILTRN